MRTRGTFEVVFSVWMDYWSACWFVDSFKLTAKFQVSI